MDQSLVKNCAYSIHQQQLVKKLINAIHHQDILVSVTEVEELELLPLLWELGFDFIQGKVLQAPDKVMEFNFPQEQALTL